MSNNISIVAVISHPECKDLSIEIQYVNCEKDGEWYFYDWRGYEEYFKTKAEAEADALRILEYVYSGQEADDMAAYYRISSQERAAGA